MSVASRLRKLTRKALCDGNGKRHPNGVSKGFTEKLGVMRRRWYAARCFFSGGRFSRNRVIKPDEDGPMSMMESQGSRARPACVTKAKFRALRNTDLPPPIGATPRSIHAACSDELGAKGISFPSCVRNSRLPSFHGEAGRKGHIPIASCKGAAVTGAGLDGIMAGTVAEKPKSGSPTASDTSVVPQPWTVLESSATLLRKSKSALSSLSATVAHVHRQMRNRTQQTPSRSSSRICSRARLKRLLSAEVNARIADSKGFRPIFNPPFSSRKEIR